MKPLQSYLSFQSRNPSLTHPVSEMIKYLKQTSGKAQGSDSIPANIYKLSGEALQEKLNVVPQDFKDVSTVHIYKRMGETLCDNHCGISLFCIARKVPVHDILKMLLDHIADFVIPESQCGFHACRGTSDIVFAVQQFQEKCHEQTRNSTLSF